MSSSPQSSWKWESVLAHDMEKDTPPYIHYFVLFIPNQGRSCVRRVGRIWNLICELTETSQLGYRAAVSPDNMAYGQYEDHITIILDTPKSRKIEVHTCLYEHGLNDYVKSWRRRVRYGENDFDFSHTKVLEYYD